MKIVFLDFDGVLNTYEDHVNPYEIGGQFYPPLDYDKVQLLNEITKDSILVIVSSWREQLSDLELTEWLHLCKIEYAELHTADRKIENRNEAVYKFLNDFEFINKPFVILDDEVNWYKHDQFLMDHLCWTDRMLGITKYDIGSCKHILKGVK